MKKKLYIINGPNLNLLGSREPEKYGNTSLETVKSMCQKKCDDYDLDLIFFQSNLEGELIGEIHNAINDAYGILINAGAFTHTSIGILDALSMFHGPKIEIHITNVYARESFRHKSYISPVVTGVIAGLGVNSYLLGIDAVNKFIKDWRKIGEIMNKKSSQTENLNIVQDFVDIVNNNDLSELEYEAKDFKIKIINNCNNLPNSQETVIHTAKANVSEKSNKIKNEPENFTNKHPGAVNSPMVGTAYSSPEPGKETFVKLNSLVSKGDTLLIIEAMKVMNSITAHKSGKVVFIGFEDSQPIEFDQLLVVIE